MSRNVRNHNVRNVFLDMCAQRRFRSACAFAQSDQNLRWTRFGLPGMPRFVMRTIGTLIRLRGCAGWFDSTLGVHTRKYFFYSFFFNKLSLEKKFIRKVQRRNVKQRRSRWDGSYEPSHLDLCCLQKPIIIGCGSDKVKLLRSVCLKY